MKIFVIVAKIKGEDCPWIVNAWDEWTVDANHEGWHDAINEAKKKCSDAEVRTAEIEVPDSFLFDMFKPIVVKGKPVQNETDDVQHPKSEGGTGA
jgi:hypothetical protein